MSNMDYFNGVTNEDFVSYFLVDLHSRMELTQYTYPHEMTEPQDVIDEHIIRCQNILFDYIRECILDTIYEEGLILKGDETNFIYDKKKEEILPLLKMHINAYIENVKVQYIDLTPKSEPLKDVRPED